jgi:hypothetical protein
VIQLGDALQRSYEMSTLPIESSLEDARSNALANIDRKVRKIAMFGYGNDYSSAWINEVHEPYGSDKAEIESTWRIEKINELNEALKNRLSEVCCNE